MQTIAISEYEMDEKFDHVLSLIKELRGDPSLYDCADDLELNVKLLQDKIRDKYWRMDEKRQNQMARRSSRLKEPKDD